jgi:hypothetical protein
MKFKDIKQNVDKTRLTEQFNVTWQSKYSSSPRYMDFAMFEVLRDLGFNGIHSKTIESLLNWIDA